MVTFVLTQNFFLCPPSFVFANYAVGCRTRETGKLDGQIAEEMAMRFNTAKLFREISKRTSGKR